jgi:hypothetical protein
MYVRRSVLRDRLAALTRLHSELDTDIHADQTQPHADTGELQTLKRMRLRVQQQIELISNQLESLEDTAARAAA